MCLCVHVQVFSVDLEEAEDLSGEFENNHIRGCNAGMHSSSLAVSLKQGSEFVIQTGSRFACKPGHPRCEDCTHFPAHRIDVFKCIERVVRKTATGFDGLLTCPELCVI